MKHEVEPVESILSIGPNLQIWQASAVGMVRYDGCGLCGYREGAPFEFPGSTPTASRSPVCYIELIFLLRT